MSIYRTLFCAVILSLACYQSYGQDTTKLEDLSLKELLDVKVVTASKTSQSSGLAPASVTVISADKIRARGYQSLQDLLLDLSDMKVDDKIAPGSRNSVTVRGIQGQQNFVILLDGVKISSPTNEAMPIMENYPVNLAEQVEVVYGPASALYGADAVSGVINIITKKLPANTDLVADVSTAAGSYGYSNHTLFLAKRLAPNSSFTISGQYNYDRQPDYSRIYPNDPQLSSMPFKTGVFNTIYGTIKSASPYTPAYQAPTVAYNIYAALHLDDFTFSIFSNYARTPSAYGLNTGNAIYNKDLFIGQRITTASAGYKKELGSFVSTTSLTGTSYTLDPQSSARDVFGSMAPDYSYAASASLKAEEQLDYKIGSKLNLTAGVSYEQYSSTPQSADLDEPVDPNGNIQGSYAGTDSYYRPAGLAAKFYHIIYFNTGAYLQAQYGPSKHLSLTLGARYDDNSLYGYSLTPRFALVYQPSSATTVKILLGSAYLAPSPSSSYAQSGAFTTADSGRTFHSSFLHLPNPNLKPTRTYNVELNIRQHIANNFSVTADGYYTISDNLHDYENDNYTTHLYNNTFNGIPVDYIEVFINEGRQISYGGSLQFSLKHTIGSFLLNSYASFSYTGGMVNDPKTAGLTSHYNSQLSFISPFIFHIGTDMEAGKFTFSPRLLIMGRQNLPGVKDTLGSNIRRQTIAGYAMLNLSAHYAFSKRFSAFINISNALNQHYRSVGYGMDLTKKDTELFYGQPEDPIRVTGGLNFHF
ncbi:MAG: TonB-dependent receptor [Bacteroidota bacterium]|nr:TonB-dependent receptor [Bacteroidota bacterium]